MTWLGLARPATSAHQNEKTWCCKQGVKLGDLQATVMGMLSAALFFVISHAKPLEHLSADRPHTMIFSLYVFSSITGQFVIHMGYLILMYNGALAAMPEVRCHKRSLDARTLVSLPLPGSFHHCSQDVTMRRVHRHARTCTNVWVLKRCLGHICAYVL